MNFLIADPSLAWSNEVYKIIHTASQLARRLNETPGGYILETLILFGNHRDMLFSLKPG